MGPGSIESDVVDVWFEKSCVVPFIRLAAIQERRSERLERSLHLHNRTNRGVQKMKKGCLSWATSI
jgi:hypothetical protein